MEIVCFNKFSFIDMFSDIDRYKDIHRFKVMYHLPNVISVQLWAIENLSRSSTYVYSIGI